VRAASLRIGDGEGSHGAGIPYLAFNGECVEAMRFYERVLGLGGKLEMMMNGEDSPVAVQIPKEHAHRILHARLRIVEHQWRGNDVSGASAFARTQSKRWHP
jgi:uncharacterized glyoxalase superfamily protein PhnB